MGDGKGAIVCNARDFATLRKTTPRHFTRGGWAPSYKGKSVITVQKEILGRGMMLFGPREDVGEYHLDLTTEAIDDDLYRIASEITICMADRPRAVYVEFAS